jgi:hypothetical protein
MSRLVCFFDEDGQTATCISKQKVILCDTCEFNPFPDRIVPADRCLHRTIEYANEDDYEHID